MSPLFTKLNLKQQTDLIVLNAPASFEAELTQLSGRIVHRHVTDAPSITFAILFVQTLAEVDQAARKVLPGAIGDPVIWFAYPKGTSKRLTCEFNRDNGWEAVVAEGFETVRQVAIDEDWSALRFRRIDHVRR